MSAFTALSLLALSYTAYPGFGDVRPPAPAPTARSRVEAMTDKGPIVEMIVRCRAGTAILSYSKIERVFCSPSFTARRNWPRSSRARAGSERPPDPSHQGGQEEHVRRRTWSRSPQAHDSPSFFSMPNLVASALNWPQVLSSTSMPFAWRSCSRRHSTSPEEHLFHVLLRLGRLQVLRELGHLLLEGGEWAERLDVETGDEAAVVVVPWSGRRRSRDREDRGEDLDHGREAVALVAFLAAEGTARRPGRSPSGRWSCCRPCRRSTRPGSGCPWPGRA